MPPVKAEARPAVAEAQVAGTVPIPHRAPAPAAPAVREPLVAPEPAVPSPPSPPAEPPAKAAVPSVAGESRPRRRGFEAWLLRIIGFLGWKRVHASNAAAHAARAAILGRVRARPGTHLRALARELDLTPQNAAYHLRRLEALGLVASQRPGRQRRYFPVEGGRALRDAGLVEAFLANTRRKEMLAAVVEAPGIRAADLARRLGLRHGSAHWGLRRLVQRGLVVEDAAGYAPTPEGLAAAHDEVERSGAVGQTA